MANFAKELRPSYYLPIMNMNQKISMREKVGYSLGDVAANLVFQMMMIFQLKFYTDIFGLDGAAAGSVLLIARVVDAFIDPLAGILSDRTQTRWGKYKAVGALDSPPLLRVLRAGILQSRHRGQDDGGSLRHGILRLADDHVFVQQYTLLFARRSDDRRHQGTHQHHLHTFCRFHHRPVRGTRADVAPRVPFRER